MMKKEISSKRQPLSSARQIRSHKHDGAVLWLTGLSGSGKSTLSKALAHALAPLGYQCYVLDGDNLRDGLNSDLGFTHKDRTENIRRASEVANLFADAGLICIAAFISPYLEDRLQARKRCRQPFHEIYVAADLTTCEARDPKGLYKRARSGNLLNFTGISAPYEPPESPQYVINTVNKELDSCLRMLVNYVQRNIPLHKNEIK
jgi:adenylylsulfate kinase